MITDGNLNDIRKKIYQLRTAIMYSMSNDVCKLPNSIVTALEVDDEGQLWFACPKPLQEVSEYEESFPVRLHFYHKGILFHLEVSGKATIVEENFDEHNLQGFKPDDKHMLVRMSMNAIEYTEPYGKRERSRLEMMLEKGYKWMLKNIAIPHSSKPALSKNTM
jgi:hypothetical protein